ncbi:unnamed protein product [Rotaria sp. Silwood1]|nr:unnamed protein product [Rotaria sp. Silwood1]CAF3403677.1 unnamed protein product [Rotaria sp. Silwood1]CAF3416614.1 unnamed protein product [Rotaria sp. Silwood1]
MNLEVPPTYQTPIQQLPPYATAIPSAPYSIPTQQQPFPVNNNQSKSLTLFLYESVRILFLDLSTNYLTGAGALTSNSYKWPRRSVVLVCPRCGATVETRLELEITTITFIGFVILCCFTCILGLLAFWLPACKKVTHYCPYCNSALGIRHELR